MQAVHVTVGGMIPVCLLCIVAALTAQADAGAGAAPTTGLQQTVVFDAYTPLSDSEQLERRLLSPLVAAEVRRAQASLHGGVSKQAIDLAKEHFAIHVPRTMPENGYGLLVFVPPWEEATVPPQWIGHLDKHGFIFVTASKSGNDANVLDRREPLAVLAVFNVMRRYRVDSGNVYVGGFSGGSRVALHLALAYPDLFDGALLDAGSDPIGTAQIPLPPADLMHRFQESARLVYMTGADDAFHLDMDAHSRDSLRAWCVFDMATVRVPFTGHELAGASAFGAGLDALRKREASDAEKLASCRARYQRQLDDGQKQVAALAAGDKQRQATELARKIDQRFGGLVDWNVR